MVGGMFGAFLNSVFLWAAGTWSLTDALGVSIHPQLTWAWLRPRLLWGGIWGAGFTPLAGVRRVFLVAVLYSLAPSAVQLFYVFPNLQGQGVLGTALGSLTPVVVLAANAVYGLGLALWVRLSVASR